VIDIKDENSKGSSGTMMTLLSIAHVHRALALLRLALLQFGLLAAAAPAQPPAIAGGGRPEGLTRPSATLSRRERERAAADEGGRPSAPFSRREKVPRSGG